MSTNERPFVIGLTGPIGCGKSTVARMIGDLGAHVIDADRVAHEVMAPGEPVLNAIRARFGDAVILADGRLDRPSLGRIVFNDPKALRELEAIVHPAVRVRIETLIEKARDAQAPLVVLEAIKLVEGGLAAQCDEVWLVECSGSTQRARLTERGLSETEIEARIQTQRELVDRVAGVAARQITTDGSLEMTRERVEEALADALDPISWLNSPDR